MLVSKLEEYPHIGTKKYITNIHAMVWQVYQRIVWNQLYSDRRNVLDALFKNYQDKRWEQKIYDPEVYSDVEFIRNFWNSESVIFVLNNQIGDTTLSIPLLISLLKSGKRILIFTVHIELVKNLLLCQEWVDIAQVTFFWERCYTWFPIP